MGSQKTKAISWAFNLCQVRYFSSSEAPSNVGMATQHHLKPQSAAKVNLSEIPLTKWRCPPKFEISSQWQVVAGEDSKEMEVQNQRQTRVVEAIYPRPHHIPPNPSNSTTDDLPASFNNQRNLIDYNLLAKLLSNSQIVKQLIAIRSASSAAPNIASTSAQSTPISTPPSKITFNPTDPTPSAQIIRPEYKAVSTPAKDINYYRSLIQQYGGQTQQDIPPQRVHYNGFEGCRERGNAANQNDSLGKRRFNCTTRFKV